MLHLLKLTWPYSNIVYFNVPTNFTRLKEFEIEIWNSIKKAERERERTLQQYNTQIVNLSS